jgi:hypothetical protein
MAKFCKDCKYHLPYDWGKSEPFRNSGVFDRCSHPEASSGESFVTGKRLSVYCDMSRLNSGSCKPLGILWEPKEGFEEETQRAESGIKEKTKKWWGRIFQ